MKWDDLRIVRAVFQSGSFAAAARRLNINETTVSRRLNRFERELGSPLFDAVDGSRRPTEYCLEVVALADEMAARVERIENIGQTQRPVVTRRRVAATDSIAVELLAPDLPRFLRENPGVAIDFLVSTENVDFSRWQADLAIRLQRPARGDFLISKLGEIAFYFVEPADRRRRDEAPVCAYPEELDNTPESEYLASIGLAGRASCRAKNLLIHRPLIQAGRFRGILPSFMCGELLADKSFVLSKLPHTRSAWLLMQKHLKDDDAARLIGDWIRERFSAL